MVIIESHGSNKVVNKLCCPLLNSLKGSGTPEVLNASRQKGTSAKVNNRAIALPSYLTSYPHTSNCADGLRSRSRSSLGNTSKRYDDSLLTSSQNHVSSIPQLSSVRPFCLGCDKTNKPASSEAITRSFTFVNSSTVASPKPTLSSVQKASPSCSDSLTNSSIYVETDDGNFHWRKRKRKLPVQDITSLLYSYLFGYKKLRLFVWYVIFIMCALIEGCMCSSLCAESPKMLPGFLQVDLNQSSVGPEQGQCLTMQNDFAEYVCDQSKANRMKAIRKVNTNFCGLPLYNILNNTEKDVIEQCSPSYGCLSTLTYIQDLDSQLSEIYCSFMDILERMDCEDRYSYNGNCESCKEAYKQWLCTVHFDYYQSGVKIKPCIQVCDQVTRNCPFFRPYGDTHIGEPGFLCKDLTIHHDDAAAIYGHENCCFYPCQVFIMDEWNQECPQLNITSNCSSLIN